MTEGYDSLVDRLMACDGLDRDEAEEQAMRILAAGEVTEVGLNGRSGVGRPSSASPAASFRCVPCPCGGMCEECDG